MLKGVAFLRKRDDRDDRDDNETEYQKFSLLSLLSLLSPNNQPPREAHHTLNLSVYYVVITKNCIN